MYFRFSEGTQWRAQVALKMTLSSDCTVRKAFFSALRKNDLNAVKAFLVIGADVNWLGDDGYFSGLFHAVEMKGHFVCGSCSPKVKVRSVLVYLLTAISLL